MNYDRFLRNNLIKKVNPNSAQIQHQIKRSEQDLETAQANLSIDTTWSLTIAYHAMIRACRALMYAQGYLPTAQQTHKTLVEFAKVFLGENIRISLRNLTACGAEDIALFMMQKIT
jgi:hypothetical protein